MLEQSVSPEQVVKAFCIKALEKILMFMVTQLILNLSRQPQQFNDSCDTRNKLFTSYDLV